MADKRVALVTGASSGIGEAIARRLLDDGYTVYVAARRVERMADLAARGAIAVKMDITREEDVTALADRIEADHGGVDVLINNAGFGSYGAMEDTSLADARYQFEVNLFGPALLTQKLLPSMRRKRRARIVNISSMGGKMYTMLGSWYHATKHAIEGWSDCLRLELAPFGIDVIIIEPGIIGTEFGETMLGPLLERSGDSAYANMARRMAAATARSYGKGRGSPPEGVARAVSKAVAARRPKTRYVMGRMARPLIFLRTWLPDRLFDRLIRSAG